MIKFLYKLYYRLFPLEMVGWWKQKEAVRATLTIDKQGHQIMWMEGEKYPFPGYPRGHLLVNGENTFTPFSTLKHQIKNRIFNEAWAKLEEGVPKEQVLRELPLEEIYALAEESRYDMVPFQKLVPCVKEMYRAWGSHNPRLRDIFIFIMQEDDAYRMRFQFLAYWAKKKGLDYAFDMLENAEVVGDMKERIRLIKRILLLEPTFLQGFIDRLDLKKVRLSKADLYFFRAKYFRPDLGDPNTLLGRIKNEVIY